MTTDASDHADTEPRSGTVDPDDPVQTTTGETEEGNHNSTERILEADLFPSFRRSSEETESINVDIYVVTGRHGIVTVPEEFCRECHMFTRRADQAAEQVDADVDVRVFSWWTRFLGALSHGGYHPPVMVVGGKRLCQGHDVPTTDEVVAALEETIDQNGNDL